MADVCVEPIIHEVLMIVRRGWVPLGLFGRCWAKADDNLSNKRGREEWGKDMPVVECRERRIIHVQSVEKNLIRGTDFIEGIGWKNIKA